MQCNATLGFGLFWYFRFYLLFLFPARDIIGQDRIARPLFSVYLIPCIWHTYGLQDGASGSASRGSLFGAGKQAGRRRRGSSAFARVVFCATCSIIHHITSHCIASARASHELIRRHVRLTTLTPCFIGVRLPLVLIAMWHRLALDWSIPRHHATHLLFPSRTTSDVLTPCPSHSPHLRSYHRTAASPNPMNLHSKAAVRAVPQSNAPAAHDD
jgi:hypothetical protein